MILAEVGIYLVIGVLAGFLAGLLGIGGGIVTVPLLVLVFHHIDIPENVLMQLAIGTSLSAMVVNTFFSLLSHAKRHRILWHLVRSVIPGTVVGALIGSIIAKHLSGDVLQLFLGIFECSLAIWFALSRDRSHASKTALHIPKWILTTLGVGVGTLASLMGISGGQITLPILSHLRVPLTKAIGTSSLISFVVSLSGAIAYTLPNIRVDVFRDSFGFLYLPAFVPISIACFFFAPIGARLCGILPTKILRRIFSSILFVTGISLIIFR